MTTHVGFYLSFIAGCNIKKCYRFLQHTNTTSNSF